MGKNKYIGNFVGNFFRLLKIASKSKRIDWDYLVCTVENCEIDIQAKIYPNHNLKNVTVGKGTYISYNARISSTTIGKFCSIGPNLICGWGVHPIYGISTSPVFYSTKGQLDFTFSRYDKLEERKQITIGNDVFIGMNVTILDGINIGDGAVIGAGAVVSKNIPPYAIAVGNPIQILKYRFSEETIQSLLSIKWWDKDEKVLMEVEKSFFRTEHFLRILRNGPNKEGI